MWSRKRCLFGYFFGAPGLLWLCCLGMYYLWTYCLRSFPYNPGHWLNYDPRRVPGTEQREQVRRGRYDHGLLLLGMSSMSRFLGMSSMIRARGGGRLQGGQQVPRPTRTVH